ncbi:MAG: TRAP transporter small permease [Chloroflexi bacterium]|nr:TRAP transporter small permease [Chloroflexota bacterium]
MERIRSVFGRISTVGNAVAAAFLALIAFLMSGEIIGRYVFNHPIPGTFEIVGAAMAVLASIGFAFGLEQQRHVRATIATERLSSRGQHVMLLLAYFVGFLVNGFLTWRLVLSASVSIATREYTPGLVPVPIYVPKTIFVFAVMLFTFGFLLHFIEGLKRPH